MYKDALDGVEKAGVKMTPIELPKFPTRNIRYILTAEAATAFDDITRDGRVNQLLVKIPAIGPTVSALHVSLPRLNTCEPNARAFC